MSHLSAVPEEGPEGGGLGTGETTGCLFLGLSNSDEVYFERVKKLLSHLWLQINHVHFLYRPSPDFPPSVLCTCLRSTLRVASFSRLCVPAAVSSCPGDGLLPRLLLEKNLALPDYLWLCHLSAQLSHR